ncbi:unnamed protein product, partial [Scytosiphon promiscuus]
RRVGFPEVVFGEGKSAEQIIDILEAMIRDEVGMPTRSPIVATRVSPEKWAAISAGLPGLRYHADARIVSFGAPRSLAGG